jgi:hypothetical protein
LTGKLGASLNPDALFLDPIMAEQMSPAAPPEFRPECADKEHLYIVRHDDMPADLLVREDQLDDAEELGYYVIGAIHKD